MLQFMPLVMIDGGNLYIIIFLGPLFNNRLITPDAGDTSGGNEEPHAGHVLPQM